MKDVLKKDWKFFCVLLVAIVCILLMCFYSLKVSDSIYYKSEAVKSNDYIKGVGDKTKIVQKFIATRNNLQKIDLNFEPLIDQNGIGGIATIGLMDEDDNIIKEEKITRNNIRENTVYSFEFDMQKNSIEHQYKLYIEFEESCNNEKYFSVRYNNTIGEETSSLTVNDKAVAGTLSFQQLYKSTTKLMLFTVILIVFSIAVVVISVIIYYKKNIKIEKLFLITVPFIAIMFMITMPTFKNHDELYHWYRAYEVSIGKLVTGLENGIEGTEMPESVRNVMHADWTNMKYTDVRNKLNVKLNKENTSIIDPETASVYSCSQYVPQAIGIAITRLFTDNVMLMTYGGRIANLIMAIVLMYFAIKIIPFGKKILLVLAYIPIAIEGFSSLSPDAMAISLSMFYIAYILYLAFNENTKVDKKAKIILTISSVLIALCKIVYIPLVGLIIIIPKEKFAGKNNKNAKSINISIIMAIAIIVNLLWLAYSGRYLANFRDGDSKYQIISILQHPIQYIQMCLYTLNVSGSSYITSMLGSVLGWGELIKVYSIVPYSLLFIITFITMSDNTVKEKFSTWQKIVITLVILAIIALIFTSLYVQWTTPRK